MSALLSAALLAFTLLLPVTALTAPMKGKEGTAAETAALAGAPAFFGLLALPFLVAQTSGWLAPAYRLMAAHELLPLRVPILLLAHLYLGYVLFAFLAVGPRRGFLRATRVYTDALFSFLYSFFTPTLALFGADLAYQALAAGQPAASALLPALFLPPAAPCVLPLAARLAVPMRRRPDLEEEARDLFEAAGIAPPVIREAAFRTPFHNGFSFGNRFCGHMVALTAATADQFSREERRAVFAHEAGHLARRDLDRHLLGALAGGLLLAAALFAVRAAGWLPAAGGLGAASLALGSLSLAGMIVQRGAPGAEEAADRFAIERGLAAPLLSALGKIWGVGRIGLAGAAALSPAHRRRALLLLAACAKPDPA